MSEYAVTDPRTGEVVRVYPTATDEDVADALGQAAAAHARWGRTTSVAERAELLHRVADLHEKQADRLAEIIVREMGKPFREARGEVVFSAMIYRYYADNAAAFLADEPIELMGGAGTAVIRRAPIGPLLGIMPWNFPCYQVARFAAPNLAAGNTIVLKHAPQCPESAAALEEIFTEAGFPEGAYVNVYATNEQVATMIADPRIQAVSLTGSERAGAAVAEIAGRHLKKVVLELGGSDPFLVLGSDDLDATVRAAVAARLHNTGQACNAAKRFIVVEELYDAFVEKFHARLLEKPVTTPLSSEAAAARLADQVDRAVAAGAELRSTGEPDGAFFPAGLLTGVTRDNPAFHEELFGPVAMAFRVASEQEAVELANDTPFGLGSYVFTTDPEQARRVADLLDVGMVFVNGVNADGVELPFGGVKRSGFGRELGRYGIEEFVNKKLVRTITPASGGRLRGLMGITSYDPRTGRPNGTVADTPATEVQAAVARTAAAAPVLAGTSPAGRRGWLHAVADALEAHAEELVALADSETGLGGDRLTGEVARAAGQLRFYGDVAAEGSFLGVVTDSASGTTPALARVNQPLGPVAVFGASNFPFAFGVLGNDTGSAIAAGCPVVVKAHPAHPLLSRRLVDLAADALRDAGAPAGTLESVSGYDAGIALVRADTVTAVAFTGSQAGGMALWRHANDRAVVIPVYAEMGTVNPVVVTRAALSRLEEVAAGLVGSFTLGSGQFCTKPGLVLAPRGGDVAGAVAKALRSAGPAPVMLTEGIAAAVRTGLAEITAAGGELVEQVEADGPGWVAPAAVVRVPLDALRTGSRLLEECFGPVVLLAEYDDDASLAAAVGRLQGALAASVITAGDGTDPEVPGLLGLLAPKVGRVAVDDWPTGVAFTWAQHHGGPWPSTTDARHTSVGAAALDRFVRPVTYQSVPDEWLPAPLRAANPWRLPRRVDGVLRPA